MRKTWINENAIENLKAIIMADRLLENLQTSN